MTYEPNGTINSVEERDGRVTSGMDKVANGMFRRDLPKLPDMADADVAGLNKVADRMLGRNQPKLQTANDGNPSSSGEGESLEDMPDANLAQEFLDTIEPYVTLTPEEKSFIFQQSGIISRNGGNAQEWVEDYLSVNAIANSLGISRTDVINYRAPLLDYYLGIEDAPLKFTWAASLINSFKQGQRQNELADAQERYRNLFSEGIPYDSEYAQHVLSEVQQKQKEMEYYSDATPHSWIIEKANQAIQQVPYSYKGFVPSLVANLVGNMVLPGSKDLLGKIVRTGIYYGQFAGAAFYNMLEAGVSPETAYRYSAYDGIINAINEAFLDVGYDTLSGIVSGSAPLAELASSLIPDAVADLAKKGALPAFLLKLLFYMGLDSTGEFLQESTQELTSWGIQTLAEKSEGLNQSRKWTQAWKDSMEAGIQGWEVGMFFGLGGAAARTVVVDIPKTTMLRNDARQAYSREAFVKNEKNRERYSSMSLKKLSDEDIDSALGTFWDRVNEATRAVEGIVGNAQEGRASGINQKMRGEVLDQFVEDMHKDDNTWDRYRNAAKLTTGEIYDRAGNVISGKRGEVQRMADGKLFYVQESNGDGTYTMKFGNPAVVGRNGVYEAVLGAEASGDGNKLTQEYLKSTEGTVMEQIGEIRFRIDDKTGALTIEDVAMAGDDANLMKDAVNQLREMYGDYGITWNAQSETEKSVYDSIVKDNPRGEDHKMNYTERTFDSKDKSEVERWLGDNFSRDANERSLLALVVMGTARRMGMSGMEFIDKYIAGIERYSEADAEKEIAADWKAKGKTSWTPEEMKAEVQKAMANVKGGTKTSEINGQVKATIYAGEHADPTTFMHELDHLIMLLGDNMSEFTELMEKVKGTDRFKAFIKRNLDIIAELRKKGADGKYERDGNGNYVLDEEKLSRLYQDKDNWTREEFEVEARLAEAWRRSGKTLNPEMKGFFRRIAEIMRNVYYSMRNGFGNVELNDEVVEFFDRLYGYDANGADKGKDFSNVQLRKIGTLMQTAYDQEAMGDGRYDDQILEERQQVVDKYKGTDQWMKAPNGKATNLSEDQWITVRTQSFLNWFGDWLNDPQNASKVVDENGEPLVMYHGTFSWSDFDTFDIDMSGDNWNGYASHGKGFYFTSSEDDAFDWVRRAFQKRSDRWDGGATVMPVFLNIRNPFTGFMSRLDISSAESLADYGYDGYFDDAYGEGKYLAVATDANQIKSATDNNGHFDENSDSILRQIQEDDLSTKSPSEQYNAVKEMYRGTSQYMMAPNGMKTNLTERQWVQVRTPAFKEWFGDWENNPNDCGILDENGEPKVFYHQTDADFDTFDTSYELSGRNDNQTPTGIFLKSKPNDIGIKNSGDIRQMPLFANIRRYYLARNREEAQAYFESKSPEYKKAMEAYRSMDERFQAEYDKAEKEELEKLGEAWNKWKAGEISEEEYQRQGDEIMSGSDDILDRWKKEGDRISQEAKGYINQYFASSNFDGMVLLYDAGGFGKGATDAYIAFRSNQVKSATDNNGAFSQDEDSILYSRDEETSLYETFKRARSMLEGGASKEEIEAETGWNTDGTNFGKNVIKASAYVLNNLTNVDAPAVDVPKEFSSRDKGAKVKLVDSVLIPWVLENLKENRAKNADVGEVLITKKGIRNSLLHGFNQYKARIYPVLDRTIENSRLLSSYYENGRLHSHILGAMVSMGEGNYFVGIIVNVDKEGNKFYSHAIIQKNMSEVTSSSRKGESSRLHPTIISVFDEIMSVNADASSDTMLRQKVNDPETVRKYETEETITTYRAMQKYNGQYYSPMAKMIKGKPQPGLNIGDVVSSEGHPEYAIPVMDKKTGLQSIDKKTGRPRWQFPLEKGEYEMWPDGTYKLDKKGRKIPLITVPAAYNPYIHSSLSMLNDQFSTAYKRPNLVVVEVQLLKSDVESGFWAEKAKDPVGATEWKAGPVAGKLAKKNGARVVYLSTSSKLVREVPASEVAQNIKGMLDGTDVTIPDNVVTPSLLEELKNLGVPITESEEAREWNQYIEDMKAREQETARSKAQAVVDESMADAGEGSILNQYAYHGSGASFQQFLTEYINSGAGSQAFGWGLYFSESDLIGKAYAADLSFDTEEDKQHEVEYWQNRLEAAMEGVEHEKKRLEEALDANSEFYRSIAKSKEEQFRKGIERASSSGGIFAKAYSGKTEADIPQMVADEMAKLPQTLRGYIKDYEKDIRTFSEKVEYARNSGVGRNLYKVDLPDTGWLEWEGNVTDYPGLVEKVAAKVKEYNGGDDREIYGSFKYGGRVSTLYAYISDALFDTEAPGKKSDEKASRLLNELGYTGFRYDAGSNFGVPAGAEGATNFVVFKQDDVKIVKHWTYQSDEEAPDTTTDRILFQRDVPDEIAKEAMDSLQDFSISERTRIAKNMEEHKDTPWYNQVVFSLLARRDMKALLEGREIPEDSILNDKSVTPKIKAALSEGIDGVFNYINQSGIIGNPSKPKYAVNSSLVNCNPSKDCAMFCYASKGRYELPSNIVKSELINLAVEADPIRAARMTALQYKATTDSNTKKALRIFDKGDFSASYVKYVQELNRQGVATQIFSKRPEFLSQIDQKFNVIMLSIDASNVELAANNPDLPLAIVYSGERDNALIAENKERFEAHGGVILPVKIGNRYLSANEMKDMPDWARRQYTCPIDAGKLKIGEWTCRDCDKTGRGGCFFHRSEKDRQEIPKALDRMGEGEKNEQIRKFEQIIREELAGEAYAAELRRILGRLALLRSGELVDVDTSRTETGNRESEGDSETSGGLTLHQTGDPQWLEDVKRILAENPSDLEGFISRVRSELGDDADRSTLKDIYSEVNPEDDVDPYDPMDDIDPYDPEDEVDPWNPEESVDDDWTVEEEDVNYQATSTDDEDLPDWMRDDYDPLQGGAVLEEETDEEELRNTLVNVQATLPNAEEGPRTLDNPSNTKQSTSAKAAEFGAILVDSKEETRKFLRALRRMNDIIFSGDTDQLWFDPAEEPERYEMMKTANEDLEKGASQFIRNLVYVTKNSDATKLENLSDRNWKIVAGQVAANASMYMDLYYRATGDENWAGYVDLESRVKAELGIESDKYRSMSFTEKRKLAEQLDDEELKGKLLRGGNITEADLRGFVRRQEARIKAAKAEIEALKDRDNAVIDAKKKEVIDLSLKAQKAEKALADTTASLDEYRDALEALTVKLEKRARNASLTATDTQRQNELKRKVKGLQMKQKQLQNFLDDLKKNGGYGKKSNQEKEARIRASIKKAEDEVNALKAADIIDEKEAVKRIERLNREWTAYRTAQAVKEIKEDIRKAEEARRAARKLRAEKEKLARQIMRKPSDNVHIDEAEKILALQETLDPAFRKKMKVDGNMVDINDLKAKFRANPGDPALSTLTEAQLLRIAKKSLDEMTLGELEQLADTISNLRSQGLQKRMAYVLGERQRIKAIQNDLIAQIRASEDYREPAFGGGDDEARRKKALPERLRSMALATYNMARKAQMMDGDKKGAFYDLLVRQKRACQDVEMRTQYTRTQAIREAMAQAGVKPEDLYGTVNVKFDFGTVEYSVAKLGYVFLANNNVRNREAVSYGVLVSDEEKRLFRNAAEKSIIGDTAEAKKARADFANDRVRQIGDARWNILYGEAEAYMNSHAGVLSVVKAIEGDFNSKGFDRVVDIMRKVYNVDVERDSYYLPNNRDGFVGTDPAEKVRNDLMNTIPGTKGAVEKGFTKSKIDIPPIHQSSVNMDLFQVWQQSVRDQEHLLSTVEYVRTLNGVFENKSLERNSLRNMISSTYGDAMMNAVDMHLKEIADPDAGSLQKNGRDELMKLLKGNVYSAYLGFKLSAVTNQLITSPAAFLGKVGPVRLGMKMLQFTTSWKSSIEKVHTLSAFMRSRNYDIIAGEISENAKNVQDPKLKRTWAQIQEFGLKGLEFIDEYCVSAGWLAIYEQEIERLGGLETAENVREAVKIADEYVMETQPLSDKTELAPMFKNKSEAESIFFQFQSSLNVVWQNVTYDVPKAFKNHAYRMALGTIVGYMMAGALLGLAHGDVNGKDDDEDRFNFWKFMRRLLHASTTQFTEGVPLVSNTVENVTRLVMTGDKPEYMSSSSDFPAFDKTMNALLKTGEAVWSKDPEDLKKALEYAIEGTELTLGLPYSMIREVKKIPENGIGALVGYRK